MKRLFIIIAVVAIILLSGCVENKKTFSNVGRPSKGVVQSNSGDNVQITENDIKLANQAVKSSGIPSQKIAQPEDIFVYALIKYHNVKGIIVPSKVVENGIESTLKPYGIGEWKKSAIRKFWIRYSTTKFKNNEIGGINNIVTSFGMYLDIKDSVRLGVINRQLGILVTAEDMRQRANNDWLKYQNNIKDEEEQSAMERYSYQVLSDADWAIKNAANAVENNR